MTNAHSNFDDTIIRQLPDLPVMAEVSRYCEQSWRKGIVSNGDCVRRFQSLLAAFTGYRHCVCVSSGTVALIFAIREASYEEQIDIPSFTWMSTAHAADWADRDIRLLDVYDNTWCLDRTPVEYDGDSIYVWPFGVRPEIIDGPVVIGDACQALGADISGCDVACLSFSYSKVLTTGEGGACLTNDESLAERIRSLRDNGKIQQEHCVDCGDPGFSARMTEWQGAMGIAGMNTLTFNLERRRKIASLYIEHLECIPDMTFHPQLASANWGYFPVRTPRREDIRMYLRHHGIDARPYFNKPLHRLQYYHRLAEGKKFPVTDSLSAEVMTLPIYAGMSKYDVQEVIRRVKEA